MNLEPTVFKLRSTEIVTGRNIKLVRVLTTGDWHISPIVSERQEQFLSEGITEGKPDIIILQGDLIDSPDELENPTSLEKLKSQMLLCSLSAPTVLVLGSHDFITPTRPAQPKTEWALKQWRRICRECDVKLLLNDWYTDGKISIFGAFQDEDYCLRRKRSFISNKKGVYHGNNPEALARKLSKYRDDFDSLDNQKVNWFAAHSPKIDKKTIQLCKNFDVMSFGHTHGGIVPRGLDEIFEKHGWNFGIISPEKTLFPRFVRGIWQNDTGTYTVMNAGMVGAQNCAPKITQMMNFIKAAEINITEVK